MWPWADRAGPDVLRIGRLAVERWTASSAGLRQVGRHAIGAGSTLKPTDLLSPLSAAMSGERPSKNVVLIVESAWLPLVLADAGGALWAQSQADALVRHRLKSMYGSAVDDLTAWDVRADFVPGQRWVLGYGLMPGVQAPWSEVIKQAGGKAAGLLPAWAWGWQRMRPRRLLPRGTGWWGWMEQDRLLLARMEGRHITGFQPAAPLPASSGALVRSVQQEARRAGVPDGECIACACWDSPTTSPADGSGLTWHALSPPQAAHVPARQEVLR